MSRSSSAFASHTRSDAGQPRSALGAPQGSTMRSLSPALRVAQRPLSAASNPVAHEAIVRERTTLEHPPTLPRRPTTAMTMASCTVSENLGSSFAGAQRSFSAERGSAMVAAIASARGGSVTARERYTYIQHEERQSFSSTDGRVKVSGTETWEFHTSSATSSKREVSMAKSMRSLAQSMRDTEADPTEPKVASTKTVADAFDALDALVASHADGVRSVCEGPPASAAGTSAGLQDTTNSMSASRRSGSRSLSATIDMLSSSRNMLASGFRHEPRSTCHTARVQEPEREPPKEFAGRPPGLEHQATSDGFSGVYVPASPSILSVHHPGSPTTPAARNTNGASASIIIIEDAPHPSAQPRQPPHAVRFEVQRRDKGETSASGRKPVSRSGTRSLSLGGSRPCDRHVAAGGA